MYYTPLSIMKIKTYIDFRINLSTFKNARTVVRKTKRKIVWRISESHIILSFKIKVHIFFCDVKSNKAYEIFKHTYIFKASFHPNFNVKVILLYLFISKSQIFKQKIEKSQNTFKEHDTREYSYNIVFIITHFYVLLYI